MKHRIGLATILSIGICAAAFAQTAPSTTTPGATAPSATAPPTAATGGNSAPVAQGTNLGASAGGMQMGDGKTGLSTATTSTVAVQFMTVKPTDTVTSRLIGTDVYNNENEKIGDIEDFVISDGKTISGVIIGVGGFLGMGERYVAVEPSNLLLRRENNDTWRAVMNTSKESLSKAPTFDYSRRMRN